jgi:hypothetical protein
MMANMLILEGEFRGEAELGRGGQLFTNQVLYQLSYCGRGPGKS